MLKDLHNNHLSFFQRRVNLKREFRAKLISAQTLLSYCNVHYSLLFSRPRTVYVVCVCARGRGKDFYCLLENRLGVCGVTHARSGLEVFFYRPTFPVQVPNSTGS